jgi:hypothetical protein
VTTDPLTTLVHSRQADLLADARRSVLAREARHRTTRPARIRSTTAGMLFAIATRLEASAARPHPLLH